MDLARNFISVISWRLKDRPFTPLSLAKMTQTVVQIILTLVSVSDVHAFLLT